MKLTKAPTYAVNVFITPNFVELPIPDHFVGMELRKDGWPKLNDPKRDEFLAWMREEERKALGA